MRVARNHASLIYPGRSRLMKHIAAIALLVAAFPLLAPAAAFGQPQGAKPGATAAAPETERTKAAAGKGRGWRATVDARHCLKFRTNLEIIRCAEKYR
jgi:hypothetical protein